MAEFVLKYADARGEIHNKVAEGTSESELRDRLTQQGFLIYSIRPKGAAASLSGKLQSRRKKLNVEKFLIFNQQFLTLIKAGLPILKSLDLLADRLVDKNLGPYIKGVRDDVRNGTMLSQAFDNQKIFPPIYVTSVMAGEKSGALGDVLDRYITYQRLAIAIKKKLLLSLIYPCVLLVMVVALVITLITFVVPKFGELYESMSADLPLPTQILIALGTEAQTYMLPFIALIVAGIFAFRYWARTDSGQLRLDQAKLRTPVLGEIWIKYQVAQFSRVLGTLLLGGIPLVQALGTASDSLGTRLLKRALSRSTQMVKEGQSLSAALASTKIFPTLAIDMIEVGESTGALPSMLSSVAEFFEDDVSTQMTASLALIEPAIMIFMGIFVSFVLIALYLPIFSIGGAIGQ